MTIRDGENLYVVFAGSTYRLDPKKTYAALLYKSCVRVTLPFTFFIFFEVAAAKGLCFRFYDIK